MIIEQLNRKLLCNEEGHPLAKVTRDKGRWMLQKTTTSTNVYLNNKALTDQEELHKYDIIQINGRLIHWADFYPERDNQDLRLIDFIHLHGRINRSNYRALMVLFIGLIPCIYLFPGIVWAAVDYLTGRRRELPIEFISDIAPYIHFIGFGLLGLIFINVSFKRIRDTGNSLWKLLLPIVNIKLLFWGETSV